jgi:hypothetical protein
MALLLIIVSLIGFVLFGIGSGSVRMGDVQIAPKPVAKCSKQMSAEQQKHCYPPANP